MKHLIETILGSLIVTGLIALARWGDVKREERKARRKVASASRPDEL